MKVYDASAIRNVAIVGHSGSGKTQLTSAILSDSGMINRFGKVDDGTTVTDFDEEEVARKHTLSASLAYAEWNKDTKHRTVSLSKGRTIEELRAERGAHRVINVAEAVELVKRWGRLGLHPLCGGCPPELAWTYLRRVVDEVMPAVESAKRSQA